MLENDILTNIFALEDLKLAYQSGPSEEFYTRYGNICPLCYKLYDDCLRCIWSYVPNRVTNYRACLTWSPTICHLRFHKPLFPTQVDDRLRLLETQLTWLKDKLPKED